MDITKDKLNKKFKNKFRLSRELDERSGEEIRIIIINENVWRKQKRDSTFAIDSTRPIKCFPFILSTFIIIHRERD